MRRHPGSPVRGSSSGRPIMVLLDVLGQRWTLRILWELRGRSLTFRQLRSECGDVSPTLLNQRLKTLRSLEIVERDGDGYVLTACGRELGDHLLNLDAFAKKWAAALQSPA